jgi:hypothetical protein
METPNPPYGRLAVPRRSPVQARRVGRSARRTSAPPPPSVTTRGSRRGSDFGRRGEHPGASMSVAWMPIGRACQQPRFTVSDVWRSQRPTRNTSIKSRDAQDPVPILVTGRARRADRRGHQRAADHAVHRGSRAARRDDRDHRPRHGHRQRHARPAQGPGRGRPAGPAGRTRREPQQLAGALAALGTGEAVVDEAAGRVILPVADLAASLPAVAGRLAAGLHISALALRRPTLEEAFLAVTGQPASSPQPLCPGASGPPAARPGPAHKTRSAP